MTDAKLKRGPDGIFVQSDEDQVVDIRARFNRRVAEATPKPKPQEEPKPRPDEPGEQWTIS
jgi:hypothetical protein